MEVRVEELEEHRKRQNGSLERVGQRLDALQMWLIGILASQLLVLMAVVITHSLSNK